MRCEQKKRKTYFPADEAFNGLPLPAQLGYNGKSMLDKE